MATRSITAGPSPVNWPRQWLPDGLGWRQGNVVGVYAHGLLDNGAYRQWFLEQLGWHGHAQDWGVEIDAAIDQVAALVTESGWAEHLERSDRSPQDGAAATR